MASKTKVKLADMTAEPVRAASKHGSRNSDHGKLAFKSLPVAKTKKFVEAKDIDTLEQTLADLLGMKRRHLELKEAAVVDYYVAAVWWAKERGYSVDQLSAFYGVIHALLNNLADKNMSLAENLSELRQMFAGVGLEGGDKAGGLETLFDVSEALHIINYLHRSLFQHYKLYHVLYTLPQTEEVVCTNLFIETPLPSSTPWPRPLYDAVDERIYYRAHPVIEDEEVVSSGDEVHEVPTEFSIVVTSEEEVDEHEAELLSQLTPEEVQTIIHDVFSELVQGLEAEISAKLSDKSTKLTQRLNKVHVTAKA